MASKKKKKTDTVRVSPKVIAAIAAAAAVVCVVGVVVSSLPAKTGASSGKTASESAAAAAEASDSGAAVVSSADDINITHYAVIDIKDYGTVTAALDGTAAPDTVANFVKLAESGFYDGLTFHRIIDGFMIQGGDPNGNGTGGSDETIKGEFSENGFENPLSHARGAISMARSQDMNSASSQFFIVQSDSTFLDGSYAAFGYVTEGMDVVDKICKEAKPADNNGTIPSDQQPVISSVTVTEAGAESEEPSAG